MIGKSTGYVNCRTCQVTFHKLNIYTSKDNYIFLSLKIRTIIYKEISVLITVKKTKLQA